MCLMALILSVLIFCALEYNWSFHIDASGGKFGFFFLLFLLLRKWEPMEKEPNFSARSDQYSSVAVFTDFANL